MPVAALAISSIGDAVFVPLILIGTPLFTDDGPRIGTVARMVPLAAEHFLIVAKLNDKLGGQEPRTSSEDLPPSQKWGRLQKTADAIRRSYPLVRGGTNPFSDERSQKWSLIHPR